MRIVLFLLGLLFSADALYCGATGSMGIGEGIITLIGVFLIIWSSCYDAFKTKGFLRFLKGVFVFFVTVFVAYSIAVCAIGYMDNATGREDYVVVLGAKIEGAKPSQMLASRLDKAVEFLNRNQNAKVIVTGGQGKDEITSEAHIMSDYLISRGVDESRIMLEENASSTYENFVYTEDAINDGTAVFITNEFHVARASLMADLCEVSAKHIAAPTPLVRLPGCVAREMVAQIDAIKYYIH